MEQETITVQEIACYVQKGMSKDGKSVGFFKVHSVRPKFFDRAKELGISPEDLLTNSALAPANDATEQVQQA
ncbi:MAG: hypothetical protein A3A81_08695 [Omnitrophica bacterium RIFCSPLOWO2_01_FULL_45_10b]|nr:MAG: hypothetical protein A3A81_08695 [Omnitrophica bacterium RIFCSPLOWO2_01_FULL_45_10b]